LLAIAVIVFMYSRKATKTMIIKTGHKIHF